MAREELHQLVVLLVVADEDGLPNAAEDVRAVEEILLVDVAFRTEVVQGDLEQDLNVVGVDLVFLLEHRQSLGDHVDVDFGHRTEASADGQNVLLVQHVGSLTVASVG